MSQEFPEQQRYSVLLHWGSRSGLALLVISFAAYVAGLLPAHIPLEQLPQVWSLPSGQFIQQTGAPTGWGWLGRIGEGDYAAILGIAWLSGCSLLPLLAVIPVYLSRRDRIFAAICAVEIAILLLAASGILAAH